MSARRGTGGTTTTALPLGMSRASAPTTAEPAEDRPWPYTVPLPALQHRMLCWIPYRSGEANPGGRRVALSPGAPPHVARARSRFLWASRKPGLLESARLSSERLRGRHVMSPREPTCIASSPPLACGHRGVDRRVPRLQGGETLTNPGQAHPRERPSRLERARRFELARRQIEHPLPLVHKPQVEPGLGLAWRQPDDLPVGLRCLLQPAQLEVGIGEVVDQGIV